jgi:hypothetical protein
MNLYHDITLALPPFHPMHEIEVPVFDNAHPQIRDYKVVHKWDIDTSQLEGACKYVMLQLMTTYRGSSTALAIGMSFDIRLWFFFLTFRSRLPFPLPVFNQMSAWAYLWISLAKRKNKTWNQDDAQSSNQSFINFPIWSVITKIPTLKWNVQCSVIPIILGYQMNSL